MNGMDHMKILKNDLSKTVSSLNEHSKNIFKSKENGGTTTSQHTNQILKEIRLTKIMNSFNQNLLITVSKGIDSVDQKVFSSNSNKPGIYMAFKGENHTNLNLLLIEGNGLSSTHKFLTDYPGRNVKNIKEGISPIPGEQNSLVKKDHPIVKVFSDIASGRGKKIKIGRNFQFLHNAK